MNNIIDIIKIKNEIKLLVKSIDIKENQLYEQNVKNINNIIIYKKFLEDMISEYHIACKKIYS
jgi:hypothetical protein